MGLKMNITKTKVMVVDNFFKDPTIILAEDNIIISDQTSVSNVLNDFM